MVYIYSENAPDLRTGIGYVVHLFMETFPNASVISQPYKFLTLSEDDIVFYPRIFPSDYPYIHDITYFLLNTKAKVIQTLFIDAPAVPLYVVHSLGKADLVHAPSTFVAKLVRPNKSAVLPIPVKPFTKRRKRPAGRNIGAILASVHERKNIEGYCQLATMLRQWNFHIVLTKDWVKFPHREPAVLQLFKIPNIIVHEDLSEEDLQDFYHSLDWFVVLSGGEAYCLPAREALRCGVPVIAPRHTAFLDLDGVKGVFLVNTYLSSTIDQNRKKQVWEFPVLGEVKQIIEQVEPPSPDDVDDPTPSFSQWVHRWQDILKQLQNEKTLTVRVNEPSALWGVQNLHLTLGLVDVSTRWAQRTNGIVFSLNERLPCGVTVPIIIPYAQNITDWNTNNITPPFIHTLQLLRQMNPKATIVLWVHNRLSQRNLAALAPVVDKFVGTTESMCSLMPYITGVLPLPIGTPCAPDVEQKDYFLIWGVNYTAFNWIKNFLRFFPHPVRFIYTYTTELPNEAVEALVDLHNFLRNYRKPDLRNKQFIVTTPLEHQEMERIIDAAVGYICIDFYYPVEKTGEASAKIGHVLRKGKPIIANDAPRNCAWIPYISPIKFNSEMISGAPEALQYLVKHIEENLQEFLPKNPPSLDVEIKTFFNFLSALRSSVRKG